MTRLATAAFAAALALVAAGPAAAQGALSDAERDAVDARIRAYLLENPEVIMEALEVLERRRLAAQDEADAQIIASRAAALYDDGYSHVFGDPNGDVTIVEFSDYRCGYCKAAHPEIEKLLEEDGDIRLVLKEFPILGADSTFASRAAMAARRIDEDAYGPFHAAMMEWRGQLGEAQVMALAAEVGLDGDALRVEMEDPAIDAQLRANHQLARDLGIEGTPSFVIGDRLVRGFARPEQMRAFVAEARDREG